MSTSLAEQLKRLSKPQTKNLVDSKKRASILFDVKEAAAKDRETIYDIGLSGLHELISINATFQKFEHTLFDKTARDLVRSVENTDVNRNLDLTIKQFMYMLSPHFMLLPAHKCLEWLIRRFDIHEYNKDDFVMLILPYHETRMFIRCVQTMSLRDDKDKWYWLSVLQRPGITLSKQVLFNRAASDRFLLKFICSSTYEAVKELGARAYTLQTLFAFYTTTVLGAFETLSEITDSHIANIMRSVSKGLASTVIDFCAASLMIIGQLAIKSTLSEKFLNDVTMKVSKIAHPNLQIEAVLLLVIIYARQNSVKQISDELHRRLIANKWIPSTLNKLYIDDGINILPFYELLLTACLQNFQLKGPEWKQSIVFCENLLGDIKFHEHDVELIIK